MSSNNPTFGSYGTGSLSVRPGTGFPRVRIEEDKSKDQEPSDEQYGFIDDSITVSEDNKKKTYKDEDGNEYVLVSKHEMHEVIKSRRVIKEEKGDLYILDSGGLKKWCDRAVFADQITKDGMYMLDPPVTESFNISIDEQRTKFNDLQSKTCPDGCPSVLITHRSEKFYKGHYVILVTWRKVWYLLPEKRK